MSFSVLFYFLIYLAGKTVAPEQFEGESGMRTLVFVIGLAVCHAMAEIRQALEKKR